MFRIHTLVAWCAPGNKEPLYLKSVRHRNRFAHGVFRVCLSYPPARSDCDTFSDALHHWTVHYLQVNVGFLDLKVYVHIREMVPPVPPPVEIVRTRQCAGRDDTDSTQSRVVRAAEVSEKNFDIPLRINR